MPAHRPSTRWVWSSAIAAITLPFLLRLTGRGWLVEALAAVPGSRWVNFALGLFCMAGWYTVPWVAVMIYRALGRKPRFFWPWWLFLALGSVALLALPTRRSSDYNEDLAAQVPGFTEGMLGGAVPLLALGVLLWAASVWTRLRRTRRRMG